jgi:octaprenyl-diphosphate synthase
VIRAIAAGSDEERAFWTRTLGRGEVGDGDLARARGIMDGHGTLAGARAEAVAWVTRAKAALSVLPDHPLRGTLADLADYVVAREA